MNTPNRKKVAERIPLKDAPVPKLSRSQSANLLGSRGNLVTRSSSNLLSLRPSDTEPSAAKSCSTREEKTLEKAIDNLYDTDYQLHRAKANPKSKDVLAQLKFDPLEGILTSRTSPKEALPITADVIMFADDKKGMAEKSYGRPILPPIDPAALAKQDEPATEKSSVSTPVKAQISFHPMVKYVFISQSGSLYKPPGSQLDFTKMVDVTSRLTNPERFPQAHKSRIEANKKAREEKLSGFGSALSLTKLTASKANLLAEKEPAVYQRLIADAKAKQEKLEKANKPFTGFTNGFKSLDEEQKQRLRTKTRSMELFGSFSSVASSQSSRTSRSSRVSASTETEPGSAAASQPKGLFDDIAANAAIKAMASQTSIEDVTPSRKVPVYE
ncbi:hypothetical protein HDV03_001901 [Kappamyces sp. JEL0829]|nr:hypothetical protein HDV03_001901 [Kappamyces sp. JEL0829]